MALALSGQAETYEDILGKIDMSAFEEAAQDFSVKDTIIGLATGDIRLDMDFFSGIIGDIKNDVISGFVKALSMTIVPIALLAIVKQMTKSSGAVFICSMALYGALVYIAIDIISVSENIMSSSRRVCEALLPPMNALMTLSGSVVYASTIAPMASVAGVIITNILGEWGIWLCRASGAVMCASVYPSSFKLDGIFKLIKSICLWGAGTLFALFVGILTIQGILYSGYDSVSVRTAKYAVDNIIPVIGGDIADSLEATLSSVMLIKSAAGITGMISVIAVCAKPMLNILSAMFALKVLSALASPVCDKPTVKAIEGFSDIAMMLITMSLISVLLVIALLGAFISAGRGI